MNRFSRRLPWTTALALLLVATLGLMPAFATATREGGGANPKLMPTVRLIGGATNIEVEGLHPARVITDTVRPAEPVRPFEVRFSGPIRSINGANWIIDGRPVTVSPRTEIKPDRSFAVVGAYAHVLGIKQPNGSVLAKLIEVVRPPQVEWTERVEFRGPIRSFGRDRWVVDGKTIGITPETKIEGTPVIGAIAEVKALRMANGALIAVQIKVHRPNDRVK